MGRGTAEASKGEEARGGGASVGVRALVPQLPPGKYVLNLRYDCEATSQVWASCSDISIV